MPRILLIDNYDSFTYNIREYLGRIVGYQHVDLLKNDALDTGDIMDYDAWIVSPGPGLPEESGTLLPTLKKGVGRMPILGICLGHQALAEIFGGKLINLGEVRHGRQANAHWQDIGPLNVGLGNSSLVGLYHSWAVEGDSIPECLSVTAYDDDGQVMAIQHKELPLLGVQFHPESILTPDGFQMVENFISWIQR